LFETHVRVMVHAPAGASRLAVDRLQQIAGAFGAFTQSRLARFRLRRLRQRAPGPPRGEGSLLSHEELATLFHPPTATVATDRLQTMELRELEPPAHFSTGEEPGAVTLGRL